MARLKRRKPQLGDALVVDYWQHRTPLETMVFATARCECGESGRYTAASGSPESARKLIYRKHIRHLATCKRQAELFTLDKDKP
jgi:hypothetical protein